MPRALSPFAPSSPTHRFSIEVDPFDVNSMINRVMQVLEGHNLERFLRGPAHTFLEERIVQRFAHQGDRASGHWPELSEATQEIRAGLGHDPDWPVNIRENEMFQTVTQEADFFGSGYAAEMIIPGSAATGVVAEKLRTAQEGRATNPIPQFGPTPPRPVLVVDEADLAGVLTALTVWIVAEVSEGLL